MDSSMPTILKEDVISKLEEDILIHENWIGIIDEHPEYAASFGDEQWHLDWIEVYENAIFYLKGGKR